MDIKKGRIAALVWLALMAAALEPVIIKFAYAKVQAPMELMAMRMLAGGFFALPLLSKFRLLRGRLLGQALAVSTLFLLANLFIYLALASVPATVVITLVASTPAFVALININRRRDKVTRLFWGGLALCLAGVALTVNLSVAQLAGAGATGLALTALAVTASTIYRTRMDDATAAVPPVVLTCYIFFLNGLSGLVISFFTGPFPESYYPPALWLGFAGVIANVAFLYALNALGSTRISVYQLLQRPLAILAAAAVLKEALTAVQLLGILLVLAGLELARRGHSRLKLAPDAGVLGRL